MAESTRKTALITGGSHGIGAATARALVQKDYFVATNYSSNTAVAGNFDAELGDKNAVAIRADAILVPHTASLINPAV